MSVLAVLKKCFFPNSYTNRFGTDAYPSNLLIHMATSENLLTNEEIAALTAKIESGSVEVGTGFNTGVRARKHDLTNEDSSLGVNVSALDMINERFIRLFRLSLLEVLRTSPRITPQRAQLMKFGDFMKNLHPPLSVNVIRMNPLRGSSMMLIDPNIILSSLDNFFGGLGRVVPQLPPGRLFTQTETRIIDIIMDVIFRSLKEAWLPLVAVDFEKVSSEINPQFAQIADENDLVIVNHFDAEFGETKGFFDIVYPYSSIKPLRELLRSRVQEVDGNDESDKQWKHDLRAALGDARVEMQVMLGQIHTTIAGFQALTPGDVLYFKKPKFSRVMINEVPAFEGQIGTSGSDMAICIEKLIDPFTKEATH